MFDFIDPVAVKQMIASVGASYEINVSKLDWSTRKLLKGEQPCSLNEFVERKITKNGRSERGNQLGLLIINCQLLER